MLSDAIGAALPELRAEAEANMTATCTIRARDGEWTTDEGTGEASQAPGTLVYSGKCRVRPNGATQAGTRPAGGAEVFDFDYVVSLPFNDGGSASVREGMPCTFDASPDPALVGITVEIQKVDRGDSITARRMFCNAVS